MLLTGGLLGCCFEGFGGIWSFWRWLALWVLACPLGFSLDRPGLYTGLIRSRTSFDGLFDGIGLLDGGLRPVDGLDSIDGLVCCFLGSAGQATLALGV